jgi:NAD(P)H-hydrate epimerase
MRDETHHNRINTKDILFWTEDGVLVPSISAEQMREVDRIAITVFHLTLLQMMENAGRSLCKNVIEILGKTAGTVTILTGAGGNGGGGLSCARHLHNHGFHVNLILDHDQSELSKATKTQFQILKAAGLQVTSPSREQEMIHSADIVVDALIGYSLHGTPYGKTEKLIKLCNEVASKVISLDVPSGIDATTGESNGVSISSGYIMTLALPKTGLRSIPGEIFVADIGIPIELYRMLGIDFDKFYTVKFYQRLIRRYSQT